MTRLVSVEDHAGGVRVLRLDTGRMNTLTLDAVRALRVAVADAAAREGPGALVLAGREDAFCAGLDNGTLGAGDVRALELLVETGDLLVDLYGGAIPVVAACRGHAVAAGAMLLLVADERIGAAGGYKIGFSEIGIGMPLPSLPVVLARERLDRRRLQSATLHGQLFRPEEAADAGFLDRVVDGASLEETALERARSLARIAREAYARTLPTVRGPALEAMREGLEAERARLAAARQGRPS